VLADHSLALLGSQTSEREHTDLSGNMAPVTLGSKSLDGSSKLGTHVSHTVGDGNELLEPLLTVLGVVEDGSSNAGTVLGRRRVVASDDDLDLAHDTAGSSLVLADEVEGTSSLTIETHDLGERLSDDHLESLIEEVTETVTILIEATTGESLVGGIEEGVEVVLLANLSNLVPLLLGRIDTSGVVSASVQEHARTSGGSLEILNHTLEVETLGLGVEVSVLSNIKAASGKDLVVVTPSGSTNIDGSGSEFLQESTNDIESTSTGESLSGDDTGIVDSGVIETEKNTTGTLGEVSKTINGQVLLVESVVRDNLLLNLADNGENERLAIVISVSTNTQVNLSGVLISLETSGKGKDRISGSLLDVSKVGEVTSDSGKSLHVF